MHRSQKFYPVKYPVYTMIYGRGQPSAHSQRSLAFRESSRVVYRSCVSSERGRFHVLLAILSDAVDIDIK
jgi:hypothetical protein